MSGRLYDLLLLSYPRRFRERNAAEMRRLFLERARDAKESGGFTTLALLWAQTIIDFAVNAPPERLRAIRAQQSAADGSAGAGAVGRGSGGGGMDSFMKDMRYAVRTLAKNPSFTVIAAITIALGIGANTAIFSVVRAVLIAPLPYEEPRELMAVWTEMTARNVENFPISPPTLLNMREQTRVFEDLAGVNAFQQPINIEGEAVQIEVGGATPNFFQLLGVKPQLGRLFETADAAPAESDSGNALAPFANPPTVTVLSHGFWQQYFGGDPSAIGRTIDLGGTSVEVIGVLPEDFVPLFPAAANVSPDVAIWTAPRFDVSSWNPANVVWFVVGRLRPGASAEQARAEMEGFSARERERVPIFATAGFEVEVLPLHEDLTAQVRPIVLALLGAVGFVLLIACANVSNLLLVRAAVREREMAVRAAMGGSRGRLVRQMLIESGVLAGIGGLLGLLLAQGAVQVLLRLQPDDLPRLDGVRIDAMVLGFTLLASVGAAVIFGLLPAVQGSSLHLSESLKDRGKASSASRNKLFRNAVVVVEVALSVVLLVGAGLMLRSFVALRNVDPGFDSTDVLTFSAPLPGAAYPGAADRALVMERMQTQLGGLPGVESVSTIFPPLLAGPAINGRYGTEEALEDESFFKQAAYKVVRPDFFEMAGAELVAGRFLTRADQSDSASVVVVDDKLAELTWPGRSAVGQRLLIRFFTNEPIWVDVVGVVKHLRHATLAQDGRETIFFPDRFVGSIGAATWMVRVNNPLAVVESVRSELAAIDPKVPMADVRLLESYVEADMAPTRFSLTLIGLFGVTALLLASVGLYGVLSSVVRQRTAEIGVRMAFGAEANSILSLVVRQGLTLAGAGMIVGLVTAFGLSGVMTSLLVDVAPADPMTFGGTALLFLAVATVSCVVPARRATRIDPMVAFRDD